MKFHSKNMERRAFVWNVLILSCIHWRKYSELSPIHPLKFRQLAKVKWTFANIPHGNSPIGESRVNFRQYTPWNFANYWRKSYWRRAVTPIFTRKTVCTVFSKIIVKKIFLRLQIENYNMFFLQFWRSIVIYKSYNVAHVGILFYNLDDYCIRPIQLN